MSSVIEKQYISPNCTLLLQGFTDENNFDIQPTMSVITQAKCQIIGNPVVLTGGLIFIQHLIKAVSAYSQELLSGLNHSWEFIDNTHHISFRKMPEKNRHLLVWQENQDQSDDKLEIELSTVQFFDLLETIDQLSQDKYILPNIQDEIKPLSSRYRQGDISLVEKSTPVALGFVSFALVAIALFVTPYPKEIKDPNLEPKPTPTPTNQVVPPQP